MALLTSATRAPRLFKSAIKTMGYGLWAKRGIGGTVTQASNRTTGVTFDTTTNRGKLCGTITTVSANTFGGATAAAVEFTVTNKAVGVNDVVVLSIQGGTLGMTSAIVSTVAEGSFKIKCINVSTTTAETGTIIINFMVLKSVVN